jgi:hypothetical protein
MWSLLLSFFLLSVQAMAAPSTEGLRRWQMIQECATDSFKCSELPGPDKIMAQRLGVTMNEVRNKKSLIAQRLGENWESKMDQSQARSSLLEIRKFEWLEMDKMYKDLCPHDSKELICDDYFVNMHLQSLGARECIVQRFEQLYSTQPAPINLNSLATSLSQKTSLEKLREEFMQSKAEGGPAGDCALLLAKDKGSYRTSGVAVAQRSQASGPIDSDKDLVANYVPESCKWVSDMPRKLVYGPSCGANKPICTGYVSCDRKNGGGVFVRLSTCGAENCSENRAVECTKQRYFFSRNPTDETKVLPSGEAKRVLESKHSTVRPE